MSNRNHGHVFIGGSATHRQERPVVEIRWAAPLNPTLAVTSGRHRDFNPLFLGKGA